MSKVAKDIKLSINIENVAEGIIIRNYFDWACYGLLKYNKDTDEILINENMLMTVIKIVNPAQVEKKIRLLSEEEWTTMQR